MNNKLFNALADRMIKLCDQHVDLYFQERPWLLEKYKQESLKPNYTMKNGEVVVDNTPVIKVKSFIPHDKERQQIELEMERVSKAIDKLCNPSEKVTDETIEFIFGSPITA